MIEIWVSLFVGLMFFFVGTCALIWPEQTRRWGERYNEKYTPFYQKSTLWDGHEKLVDFCYRVLGGVFAGLGILALWTALSTLLLN